MGSWWTGSHNYITVLYAQRITSVVDVATVSPGWPPSPMVDQACDRVRQQFYRCANSVAGMHEFGTALLLDLHATTEKLAGMPGM